MILARSLLVFLLCCFGAAAEPRRIISTAPSITETLFALGLGDRVVGVTTYCRYPPAAAKITKIGTWLQPNVELIVSLKPDLVILQETAVHSRGPFDKLGVRVLDVKFDSLADLNDSIDKIGAATGTTQRAKALRASIEQQLKTIYDRVSKFPPTPVLFLVGRTPGALDSMIAAGPHTYINEAIERSGGANIFSGSAMSYAKISTEEIIGRNPNVIIDASHGSETPVLTDAERKADIELWQRFPTVAAVRSGRVYPVASGIFLVPGPRIVDLVRELSKLLHPEAFR